MPRPKKTSVASAGPMPGAERPEPGQPAPQEPAFAEPPAEAREIDEPARKPSTLLKDLSLMEFIPALSPEFTRPLHLSELCDEFERAALGEPIRTLVAVPIRHWKTQVMLHGVVWLLKKDPSARYILLSHSFERATALGKRARQLARMAGCGPARGTDTIADWSTEEGGGIVIMSADQSRLGYDCHGLFFDDPIDETGALDPIKRAEVDETISHYTARCQRRGKPGPVMGIMSRWHPDDPIGQRLARTAVQWRYIHYPAILHEGTERERAFAENVWSLHDMKAMRAERAEVDPTERFWWAQLMNDPKPVGSDLFGQPTYYEKIPDWNFRLGYGVDFAYTAGATSDWSAFVTGKIVGTKLYILEVQRHKLDAYLIESTAKRLLSAYGYAPMCSYMAGPEVGLASFLRERGVPIFNMHARYSKLVRAQRTIKRWNDGNIVLPFSAPWLKGFLHRVSCFRGNDKDDGDDEIDAMVSLCDGTLGGMVAGGGVKTLGKAYAGLNTR